jgi:CheY-like chemotaxis protein
MQKNDQSREFRQGPRLRILLVEDEPLVQQHVSRMLAGLGHDVQSAPDGRSALTIFQGLTDLDLLFTDIVMPGAMDGVELAAHMRSLRPGLKVLLTSGYSDTTLPQARLQLPGVELLSTPYRLRHLREKLEILFSYSAAPGS